MKEFKVGDLVFGKACYGEQLGPVFVSYLGRITKCCGNGWYRIESRDDGGSYNFTMHTDEIELMTKLHKLLAGVDDV